MKKRINVITIFFLFCYCLFAEYSDSITETNFSQPDSIVISRRPVYIELLSNYEYISDTFNYNFVLKNLFLNEDSLTVYLNNVLIFDTTTITNETNQVVISLSDKINLLKIIVNDINNIILLDYNDTLYYITETLWSITDSIYISDTDSIYISDKDKILDYYRFKKILQNDINKIKIYNWFKISELTNDDYYREPNIPYKKFRKIIGY